MSKKLLSPPDIVFFQQSPILHSMLRSIKKPPLIATIFMVSSVFLLCGLGLWQIERLHWKNALLADLTRAERQPAALVMPQDLKNSDTMRRVRLAGTFDTRHEIKLALRTYHGQAGFHVLTPLVLDDHSMILVNRGWTPLDTAYAQPETGRIEISGFLRMPEKPSLFTPPNDPAKGAWYRIDLSQMSAFFETKQLAPFILYQQGTKENEDTYPIAITQRPEIPNNHLQYATFWFFMAGILVIIFFLRFMLIHPRDS